MFKKRRPSGRESLIAGATLDTLHSRDRRDAGMRALSALAPGAPWSGAPWSGERGRAIRLIDLERRARFARPLAELA